MDLVCTTRGPGTNAGPGGYIISAIPAAENVPCAGTVMVHGLRGRVLAEHGDRPAAIAALAAAARVHAQLEPGEAEDYMWGFPERQLRWYESRTFTLTGDLDRAEQSRAEALRLYPGGSHRSRHPGRGARRTTHHRGDPAGRRTRPGTIPLPRPQRRPGLQQHPRDLVSHVIRGPGSRTMSTWHLAFRRHAGRPCVRPVRGSGRRNGCLVQAVPSGSRQTRLRPWALARYSAASAAAISSSRSRWEDARAATPIDTVTC